MHKYTYHRFCAFLSTVCIASLPSYALSQSEMTTVPPAVFSDNPSPAQSPADTPSDTSLTTRETAIECALAQIAEAAGQTHKALDNPLNVSFKAGLCTGKIQTYMLAAQSQNPTCFPKISLEEGIAMFVKWADANPDQLSGNYILGFKAAFEDSIPCLKK